jgi:four helix bundle protein
MAVYSFRDLEVWQKAQLIVLKTYKFVDTFPRFEKEILGKELRRTAISVTSNIAEDMCRRSKKELLQYLYISRGSLEELRSQANVAFDLEFIPASSRTDFENAIASVSRLLNKLIKSIKPFIDKT